METDSIKYEFLKVLARSDGPMTCREIHNELPERSRPSETEVEDKEPWQLLTSSAARLYGNHYVDRRKRDAKWRPMEYWLAAEGRKILRENGDLPEGADESVPVPENTEPSESFDADEARTDSGELQPEIPDDLGLDNPEVDSAEVLTNAISGIVSRLSEVEDSVDEDLAERVAELTERVDELSEASGDGDGGEFEAYIRRLKRLSSQGYELAEGQIRVQDGRRVQQVNVRAVRPETDGNDDEDSLEIIRKEEDDGDE